MRSGRVWKTSPAPQFDPRIPATSELLYQLRTQVHRIQKRGKENIQWKQRSKKKKVYGQKNERKFEPGHSCCRHYLLSTTLQVSTS